VFVTRNGVFLEKEFLSKEASRSTVQLKEIRETPEYVSASPEESQQVEIVNVTDETCAPEP
jgi:hypothetical protein